jgi:hypothetical protein
MGRGAEREKLGKRQVLARLLYLESSSQRNLHET